MKRAIIPRWILFPFLFLVSLSMVWSQEYKLEYTYRIGQKVHYKRTYAIHEEGGFLPGGKTETLREIFYSVWVDSLAADGSAKAKLHVDSISLRINAVPQPVPELSELQQAQIRLLISKRGQLLDYNVGVALSPDAKPAADAFLNNLMAEPSLSGDFAEAGNNWMDDLIFLFRQQKSAIRSTGKVRSTFAHNETVNGISCARIDYSGMLMDGGSQIGNVRGTTWSNLKAGRRMKSTQDIELTTFVQTLEGKMQWRRKETQTVELRGQ